MASLPNIELSRKQFENYTRYRAHLFDFGGEGMVTFRFSLGKGAFARKIFTREIGRYSYESRKKFECICENKWEKVKRIYEKNPRNQVKILATLSYDKKFVGYDTSWNPCMCSMLTCQNAKKLESFEEKCIYLNQILKSLEEFHSLGIVYGDVRLGNILINPYTKKISFCDLDNMQVDHLPIDSPYYLITPFQKESKLIPPDADFYMYNLLLIRLLSNLQNDEETFFQVTHRNQLTYLEEAAYPLLEKIGKARRKGAFEQSSLMQYVKQR